MSEQLEQQEQTLAPLPAYRSILVAVDSSDHANRGIDEAVALAGLWDAKITGTHVFAARMHDVRFRQMEGGLPEQYREEQELERQRDVHDDLITRGLSVITDSYLDQAERVSSRAGVRFARRALEGKNYRELVREANGGDYELLVMGALGVGAIVGSSLGTVCERVARRSSIDVLVIKDPRRRLAHGPIVVAIDGSQRAYGGLLTALSLARHWHVPVQVLAAFDPYYHYVAFNRIAGVLSKEASKVFRFQEQEKLHEEIIDSGLAKIYEGHLTVAASIAAEHGMQVETTLLDGKPHDAIEKHLVKVEPSLLVIGKLGVHADPELDIGGNAEKLLRGVGCAVLLSQREHRPRVELVAEATTSWTREAERRMQRIPAFVRTMARTAILRYAQDRGHTVITERIVEQATAELMPSHLSPEAGDRRPESRAEEIPAPVMAWSEDAQNLLNAVDDVSVRSNLKMRAQKKARQADTRLVQREHIEAFLDPSTLGLTSKDAGARAEVTVPQHDGSRTTSLHWDAAAFARLMRVPEGFMRDACRERIEAYACEHGSVEISLDLVERGLSLARRAMEQAASRASQRDNGANTSSKCPFAGVSAASPDISHEHTAPSWSRLARARLANVPQGFCRAMTRKAVDRLAARNGIRGIDEAFVEHVLETFKSGAREVSETLPWDQDARARIMRAPEMVRGMLVQEIEAWTRRHGGARVDEAAVQAVKEQWKTGGVFHLDPDDPRNQAGDWRLKTRLETGGET